MVVVEMVGLVEGSTADYVRGGEIGEMMVG